MFSLLLSLALAQSAASERAYQRTVDLVDGLYLYPDDLESGAMLREGADSLANALHWLMVDGDGQAVSLRHGDGALIGTVSVASVETLPAALLSIEKLVARSGYPLEKVDVRLQLLKGVTNALDRYSRVLAGDGLDRFDVRLKGTLVGIGLTVSIRDDALEITKVNKGGPAERGGIQVGDRITRIDDRSTVNMPTSEATRRIRGEADTSVVLTVLRGDQQITVPLQRAEVVVPNVESRVLEGDVAYVRISHVSQRTVQNLLGELKDLEAKGAMKNGLVLDLRGNTGGSMKESARTVDQFVETGLLLRTAGPDGNQVRNLQARMLASEGGAIPPLPVVILVDDRTASGAEIVAGSLLELERAALVGTRSYGKGTVQKIYPLSEDMRLKLTVAQYLLANDRVIADRGLVPDVVVGTIELDSYGVHYQDWDEERNRTPIEDFVPWVQEAWSWREQELPDTDLVEEIGRRAVLASQGPSRTSVLGALAATSASVRLEQERHLVEALAAHGIDWNLPETPVESDLSKLHVQVTAEPDPELTDVILVTASVENRGTTPLHRVKVELESDFRIWNDLAVPIGRLDPGVTLTGTVRVGLAAGVNAREDDVRVAVRAEGAGRAVVATVALHSESSPKPELRAVVSLVGDGDLRKARVTLKNPSMVALEGVEVHFAYPGDLDVELIDRAKRIPSLAPGAEQVFELEVRLGPAAPAELPLRLVVEADRFGKLGTWPTVLPLNGQDITLQEPVITATRPLNAPVGPLRVPLKITDDHGLDHVVVYHNGNKVAWAPGGAIVELGVELELEPGRNRLVVVAVDDQGLKERRQFVVRGVETDDAVAAPGSGG